jgi:hypothetical protein
MRREGPFTCRHSRGHIACSARAQSRTGCSVTSGKNPGGSSWNSGGMKGSRSLRSILIDQCTWAAAVRC